MHLSMYGKDQRAARALNNAVKLSLSRDFLFHFLSHDHYSSIYSSLFSIHSLTSFTWVRAHIVVIDVVFLWAYTFFVKCYSHRWWLANFDGTADTFALCGLPLLPFHLRLCTLQSTFYWAICSYQSKVLLWLVLQGWFHHFEHWFKKSFCFSHQLACQFEILSHLFPSDLLFHIYTVIAHTHSSYIGATII